MVGRVKEEGFVGLHGTLAGLLPHLQQLPKIAEEQTNEYKDKK